jgi:hypothetical protein
MVVLRAEALEQRDRLGERLHALHRPFAESTVVWPLRLTAFTSAPFDTRY